MPGHRQVLDRQPERFEQGDLLRCGAAGDAREDEIAQLSGDVLLSQLTPAQRDQQVARLGEVTDRLLALGRPAEMPAAVVSQGTLPGERVVVTTLGGLAAAVARERPASPALVVVGEVVRLREELGSLYTRSIPARKRWAIRPTSSRETAASPTVIPHQRPAAPRCVR